MLVSIGCIDVRHTPPKQTPILNEKFDTFFKKFESDSNFQKSRVNFPLKLIIVGDEGDHDSTKYISAAGWKVENLLDHQDGKGILKKYVINANKVRIQFQVEDTGIQTECFFERKRGEWRLVLVKDESD